MSARRLNATEAAIHCDCSPGTIKKYAREREKDPTHPAGLDGIEGPGGWSFAVEVLDDWLPRYHRWRREKRRKSNRAQAE